MPKNYNSIDDFDKEMEEEFLKNKNEDDKPDEDVLTEDEIVDDNIDDDVDDKHENEDEDIDKDENKNNDDNEGENNEQLGDVELTPSKDDKKDYAFAELRKKYKEAEKLAKEKDASLRQWEEIAKNLGYQSADELLRAQREQTIKQEAEKKGVDPEIYRELIQLKEKVGEYEKRQKQTQSQLKLEKFTSSLDEVVNNYKLTDNEKNSILLEIEKDGYNLEDLYEIKNPKKFIIGYAADVITEKKLQEKMSQTDKEKFKEDKFTQTKTSKKTIEELQDELIKKELSDYAKKSGLNY